MTNISFNGFKSNAISLYSDNYPAPNTPVIVDENGHGKPAPSDSNFIGIALNRRGNILNVQMDGYVELQYTGTVPSAGYCGLVSNGTGGVKVSANAAKKYKVLIVKKSQNLVGFIL